MTAAVKARARWSLIGCSGIREVQELAYSKHSINASQTKAQTKCEISISWISYPNYIDCETDQWWKYNQSDKNKWAE